MSRLQRIILVHLILICLEQKFLLPALPASLSGVNGGALILLTSLLLGAVNLKIHLLWNQYYFSRRAARLYDASLIPKAQGWLPFNMDFPLVGPRRFLSDPIPGQFSSAIKERMGSRTINLNVFGVFVGMTEDPEVFKHILTGRNWTNFPKGDVFTAAARDFLGVGIFNSDGAQWKHHRTLTRPFFSKEEISNCDVFDKHSQAILSTISRLSRSPLSTSSSIPPQPQLHRTTAFDFQDLASRFTLDSATEFLFGWSVESLAELFPPSRDEEHKDEQMIKAGGFFQAFNRAEYETARRLSSDPVATLGLSWKNPVKEAMKEISPLINAIIQKALSDEKAHANKEKVFLNHLISVTKDPKEIHDELLNILLASKDTTASLLTSVVYEMCHNPSCWKKLRQEIISSFGTSSDALGAKELTSKNVRELKYLRSVLNECLRLHPPVPFNVRSCVEEDVIAMNDGKRYYVPAGSAISLGLWPMMRRQDLWGPDAKVFDPERWLDERIRYLTSNPFIFQPFSAGPRICVGQAYGYEEASICIIRLAQRFSKLQLAPDAQPHQSFFTNAKGERDIARSCALILSFKGGLWVRFTEAQGDT